MTSPQVANTAPHGSFVAQPQGTRSYARSLSTLSRPAQVVSRQTLPVRSGDALSQTQRFPTSQVPTSSQRWRSPQGRDASQPQSVKVVKARPPATNLSGTAGHAFSGSVTVSGSGFATAGGVVSSVGLQRDVRPDEPDELSRTWQGMPSTAARTPVAPPMVVGPTREKAPPFAAGQKVEYFSDNQKNWFEGIVLGPSAAGGLQVSINGHERTVTQDKLVTHLRHKRDEAEVLNPVEAQPSALSGTWRSVSKEVPMSKLSVVAPLTSTAPQTVEAASGQSKDPRLVRNFLPPGRRQPAASPERSIPTARVISKGQGPQTAPLRPFTAAANGTVTREAREIACSPAPPQKIGSYVAEPAIRPVMVTGTALEIGRGPAVPLKTGSYVAERPTTQDARQTASFTAMPMYKWGVPGAKEASRAPALRLRAVSGSHTQAGHKMRCPGGPNQDCQLVVPLSPGVLLAAVFDGHGAHGHFVSQFVRGLFERFANSLANLPENDLTEGFAKVFNLAQESLERDGLAEMAGTTATVALVNANSGVVTVAHVGDSTLAVFVGKSVSFKTKDHVVDDEAERYVRARGGDVRSSTYDGVTAKRIYHKGEDSAGLGMARALGHTELQPLVQTAPEVSSAQFGPGSILVIASDGIWEKIPPEALAEIVAAQPPTMTNAQAGSLARTLVAEARKRWHGDIDDITCVVVRAVPDISGGSLTAPAVKPSLVHEKP